VQVENSQAFTWLSQLRHRWDDKEHDCFANICDAQFRYSHEYLGNTPRLVITPLTDRSRDCSTCCWDVFGAAEKVKVARTRLRSAGFRS